MVKFVKTVILLALVAVIGAVGYQWAATKVEVDIYRDRLAGLSGEYESLRGTYNEAVRKTAVTELIVKDGKLSLAIRTVEGVDKLIDTPFDPAEEIYCDYVLLDGRLWIRRVYDSRTPPSEGLVIDENLAHVDWDDPAARYGNAVYRSLTEGRWVVTVTGDGSLGLAKANGAEAPMHSGPVPVRDYGELEKQINEDISRVTLAEVLKRVLKSESRDGQSK